MSRGITLTLLIVGLFIALPTSVVVYNHWRVALKAGSYSRAVFVVEEVGISTHRSGRSGTGRHRWARGKIDGVGLTIGLAGFDLEAWEVGDLRAELPPGSELDVWHDPSAADVITQGRTLGVIPGTTDLGSAWAKALILTVLCDGVLIAGLVGYLQCRRRGERVFD